VAGNPKHRQLLRLVYQEVVVKDRSPLGKVGEKVKNIFSFQSFHPRTIDGLIHHVADK
jgi:hypothetical protein